MDLETKVGVVFGGAFVALCIGAIVVFMSFTVVGAGERGVKTMFGNVSGDVLDSGFHWVNPLSSIHKFSVQTNKVEADASAASSDLQTVSAKVAINYHLEPVSVVQLYKEVGNADTFSSKVVVPAIQDSVKSATAQYTAEQLITKRAEVSDAIKTALASRLGVFASVESVAITNFEFSVSFNEAIERKVTAEQNAIASKNKLEQTKYEAEQKIVTAQAEAESIRIQAEAITSQGGKEYVNLVLAHQWDGVLPTTVMGDTVPFINIAK
jgi:regulator of protease activity HflC (stomatin/prohibitin superfamily)